MTPVLLPRLRLLRFGRRGLGLRLRWRGATRLLVTVGLAHEPDGRRCGCYLNVYLVGRVTLYSGLRHGRPYRRTWRHAEARP